MIRKILALLSFASLISVSAKAQQYILPGQTYSTILADTTGSLDAGPSIRAAMVSGTTSYLPPGTYLVNSVIGATGVSNWTLLLADGAVLKKSAVLQDKMVQCNNCNHIRITSSGIGKLDSSLAPNSLPGQANDAIYIAGTTSADIEVDHIWFYSGASYTSAGGDSCIFMSGSDGNIHDNIFQGCWDLAVYVSGIGSGDTTLHDTRIHDNHFINCNGAAGIKRLYQRAEFVNNVVIGGVNGIFNGEADTSNMPGTHVLVNGNTFSGMTGSAIISRMSVGDVITSNQVHNMSTALADIGLQGTTGAVVAHNTVWNDAGFSPPAGQIGIDIQSRTFNSTRFDSTKNTVTDNEVSSNLTNCVKEDDANQDFNYIIRTRCGDVYGSALVVKNGAHSVISDPQTQCVSGVQSGFGGAQWCFTQASFQGSNSNTVNIYTLSVGSSRAVRVKATVVGNTSGSNAITVDVDALFIRNGSGTWTSILNNTSNSATNYGGAPAAAWFMDTGANAVRLQITGVAGTSISWVADIQYLVVATNT